MLLLAVEGWSPPRIARNLGYHPATVRQGIEGFAAAGTAAALRRRPGPPPNFGRRQQVSTPRTGCWTSRAPGPLPNSPRRCARTASPEAPARLASTSSCWMLVGGGPRRLCSTTRTPRGPTLSRALRACVAPPVQRPGRDGTAGRHHHAALATGPAASGRGRSGFVSWCS
jgi:hypothetical protein